MGSFLALTAWLLMSGIEIDAGPISTYRVNDGYNAGELACGGRLRNDQLHVARRDWRKLGCGRMVFVCSLDTLRCALTKVMDAGPYGAVDSRGNWRVIIGKLPRGFKRRAVTDLSNALWRKLGKPRVLSGAILIFLNHVTPERSVSS